MSTVARPGRVQAARIGATTGICLLAVLALLAAACGVDLADQEVRDVTTSLDIPTVPSTSEPAVEPCDPGADFVDAAEVTIFGELNPSQRQTVEWALSRFTIAGLPLPSEIDVSFDPTRVECSGAMGKCRPGESPQQIVVCSPEEDGDLDWSRTDSILLHELGHLWAIGSDIDFQAIVGGELASPDAHWSQRTEERVATAIGWGLLDTVQRPRYTGVACLDLYTQFVALTDHLPLGPIDPSCIPDAGGS